MKMWLSFFLMLFLTTPVLAEEVIYEGRPEWSDFDRFMTEREHEDDVRGLSYLLSGALATLGGSIGYYESNDSFSRGAYAITQSVGIVAIGYGASIYWNGNDFASFYRAVRDSSLTSEQKTEVLGKFLHYEQIRRERSDWIRMGTHVLLAAVNFYSATREKDNDVKNIFQFLGGVNALIAFTYVF